MSVPILGANNPPISQPSPPPQRPRKRFTDYLPFWGTWPGFLGGLILTAYWISASDRLAAMPGHARSLPFFVDLGCAYGVALVIAKPWRAFSRFYDKNMGGNDIKIAMQGPPTPQQCAAYLIQVYGRQPTVEEINALYQMSMTEYNQHVLRAGVAIATPILMQRAMHHMDGHH